MQATAGIHHVTAIVGDPQVNMDFYAGVLGLRFVKKTVNFDDPGTYHFYFGNESGAPGTIMTFFPAPQADPGRIGSGQVGVTTFVVPENALAFWEKRLANKGISTKKMTRFNEVFLQFVDPHGLQLEIVERKAGPKSEWRIDGITPEVAIKGFGGAVLNSSAPHKTAEFMENALGFKNLGQDDDFLRFQSEGELGNVVDIKLTASPRGIMGAGTVHHIAWRAADYDEQLAWQSVVRKNGLSTTEVKDRDYFTSIYFQEFGGILFEMATDPPGFTRDEPIDKLGESLKLPSWLESKRSQIEDLLIPVEIPNIEED